MSIAFTSWQDFFAMGGYAFYVWLAVVLTLLPLSGLVGHTLLNRRALLSDIRRQQAREQRKNTARQSETMEVAQ
ncbi:heme exporter protein CcmD [Pectobacterium brasiliense]|uniref:heme exporter protein CcmD n=1 Tax=Pectobacterium brasiliense TaxID=180957 RepID=UPI00300DFA7A